MNYSDYSKYKEEALDLYEYLELYLKNENRSLHECIKNRAKNLIENKFMLAVVGEVKAGKSTFINALIGKKILPSDTLQSTSAIIEIIKSEVEYVKVRFGDGHIEIIKDNLETPEINEAIEFVKEIASVGERYRSLPLVQINEFMKQRYSTDTKEVCYTEDNIIELLSGLENIHHLDLVQFRKEVVEYIDSNRSMARIPVEVSIGYPLEWEFDSFVLVDTPGVNACGGVESKTHDFISLANAIIFLTRIKPIESKSLNSFIKNTLPNRQQDCLMLALSHASEEIPSEIEKIVCEARKLYPQIDSENIFAVDSLTELYRKQLSGKTFEDIKLLRKTDKALKLCTAMIYEEADGDEDVFMELLEAQANFYNFRNRLKEFSACAGALQLKEFLRMLHDKYREIGHDLYIEKSDKLLKLKSPQLFLKEVRAIEQEITKLECSRKTFINKLNIKYDISSVGNDYYTKLQVVIDGFKNKVNEKRFEPQDTKSSVDNYVEKILDDFSREIEVITDVIRNNIYSDIAKENDSDALAYTIRMPNINLNEIWTDATSYATRQSEKTEKIAKKGFLGVCVRIVTLGKCGYEKIKKQYSTFEIDKYWQKIQSDLYAKIEANRSSYAKLVVDITSSFCKNYSLEIDQKLDKRKCKLQDLKRDQTENNKLGNDVHIIQKKYREVKAKKNRCKLVKENI